MRRSAFEETRGSSNSPEIHSNHEINTSFSLLELNEHLGRKKGIIPKRRWHILSDDKTSCCQTALIQYWICQTGVGQKNLSRNLVPLHCDLDKQKRKTWTEWTQVLSSNIANQQLMQNYGENGNMLWWIKSFLGNRKFLVRVGNVLSNTFVL